MPDDHPCGEEAINSIKEPPLPNSVSPITRSIISCLRNFYLAKTHRSLRRTSITPGPFTTSHHWQARARTVVWLLCASDGSSSRHKATGGVVVVEFNDALPFFFPFLVLARLGFWLCRLLFAHVGQRRLIPPTL
jgi:hypothetical protein